MYILIVILLLIQCLQVSAFNCITAGTYDADPSAGIDCQSCTVGYYCTGDDTRQTCTAGTWSPAGSDASVDCTAALCTEGYYCPGDGTKLTCDAGKWSPAGSDASVDCTAAL